MTTTAECSVLERLRPYYPMIPLTEDEKDIVREAREMLIQGEEDYLCLAIQRLSLREPCCAVAGLLHNKFRVTFSGPYGELETIYSYLEARLPQEAESLLHYIDSFHIRMDWIECLLAQESSDE